MALHHLAYRPGMASSGAGGGQSRGSSRRPEPPCPGLAPCEGQERCVWAEPGPGFDPALARLGAGSTGSEGNKKGSSNLNLTAGPRPESGTPLPSRLRHSWLPSQAGPGPVLVPPRDTGDSQKDRSILSQTGWDMAQFGWGIAWLCALGVCVTIPQSCSGGDCITHPGGLSDSTAPADPGSLRGSRKAPSCQGRGVHPALHGRARARRGQAAAPCTPCHTLHPTAVPSPCSPGRSCACPWTSWRLLSSWVSVGLGGSLHTHSAGSCGGLGISSGWGCWAGRNVCVLDAVAMMMLPAWQWPWPDCHKTQRGIQAALSPVRISKHLTWLLTPCGTSQHPGAAWGPSSTGSPAPHPPHSLPLVTRPRCCCQHLSGSWSFVLHQWVGMQGWDRMGWLGVGWVYGGAGGAQVPQHSLQPMPSCSLQWGDWWQGVGRSLT